MTESTEVKLIEDISEENAPAIYVKGGLQKFLDAVTAEVSTEVPDLTTRKGRDRIASLAAKVSKSKVAVEKPGRDYLKRLKEMPKVVETELREFVDAMDALRDATRKPLTEWEEAEEKRVADHQAGLEHLRSTDTDGKDSAAIIGMIQDLEEVQIGDDWQEFEAEAHRIKTASLATLRVALAARHKFEREQAELAELRRQQAERDAQDERDRIAREAAERATQEAELRAKAEREAAEQRERDALAAAEQSRLNAELAEQRRIAAEQQAELDRQAAAERERVAAEQAERDAQARADAAAAAERQRQAEEQAQIQRDAEAREADKEHKAKINRAAMEAFMAGGMTEECAKQAVTMIAKREIPNVTITY